MTDEKPYEDLLIVAVDGPAGSGKSTVARAVAGKLGLSYLDTGAMYRSVAHAALAAGMRTDDAAGIASLAEKVHRGGRAGDGGRRRRH